MRMVRLMIAMVMLKFIFPWVKFEKLFTDDCNDFLSFINDKLLENIILIQSVLGILVNSRLKFIHFISNKPPTSTI